MVTNFFSMVSFHYAVFFRTATSFHSIFKCVLSLILKINIYIYLKLKKGFAFIHRKFTSEYPHKKLLLRLGVDCEMGKAMSSFGNGQSRLLLGTSGHF